MGKDLKGNPLPPGIMQRKSGIYRGRFYYKGETYTKDNADLKKLVQEMEDLRYEVKHGLKGKGDNITLDTWFDIWLNIVFALRMIKVEDVLLLVMMLVRIRQHSC